MSIKQIAKAVVVTTGIAGAALGGYAAYLWIDQAIADGVGMMEAANAGGALILIAFAVYLFTLAENPDGKTIIEAMVGSEEK